MQPALVLGIMENDTVRLQIIQIPQRDISLEFNYADLLNGVVRFAAGSKFANWLLRLAPGWRDAPSRHWLHARRSARCRQR